MEAARYTRGGVLAARAADKAPLAANPVFSLGFEGRAVCLT